MRYLGLDLGSRRLGVSISDLSGIIATSYKTIHHHEDYHYLVDEIGKILEEEQIEIIVLGFPKNMDNSIGPKGELSLKFKEMLEEKYKYIPVFLQDERLSTKEAETILIQNKTSRKKRKNVVDQVAAVIILQSYLDKKEGEKNESRVRE